MDWYVWLIIILILIFIELITINLTTIWFIISGIIALIISFITPNLLIQFSIFVIVGLILLFTTRKLLIKYFTPKESRINLERIIGSSGIVTETINKNQKGEVKVDGKNWTAVSNEEITEGDLVEVIKIDGVKLVVRRREE